jgi:hypothetical protein
MRVFDLWIILWFFLLFTEHNGWYGAAFSKVQEDRSDRARIYMATDGDDNNTGTKKRPYKSLAKCMSVAHPGDTIYIRGGTYNISVITPTYLSITKDGAQDRWISIFAYPGDRQVVFDFSGMTYKGGSRFGFITKGASYLHFKGIHLRNVVEPDSTTYGTPWETYNSNHIVYENCSVANCASGWTCEASDNILYLNCDAFYCCDKIDHGGYTNGFSANIKPGSHVEYQYCRAWNCSDDGFDCYGSGGYITFNGCWAFRNGNGLYGNGNGCGFKCGIDPHSKEKGVQRIVTRNLSFENNLMGFDQGFDKGTTVMQFNFFNNTSFNNLEFHSFRLDAPPVQYIQNNISFSDSYFYPFGSGHVINHNSWQLGKLTTDDFISTDPTGADGPRHKDGSLPFINFMRLRKGSDMINAGINVGLSFQGKAPDLGCFERE